MLADGHAGSCEEEEVDYVVEAILAEDPIVVARALRRAGHPASLNLVYALAGARLDLPWNALPTDLQEDLRQRWKHSENAKNGVDI